MGNIFNAIKENKGTILKKGLYGVLIGGGLAVAAILLAGGKGPNEEDVAQFIDDINDGYSDETTEQTNA
jgi:hypothetical protein